MQDFWRITGTDKFEICQPGQPIVVIKKDNTYEFKAWDGRELHLIMAWMPLPKVKKTYELISPS